MTKLSGQTLFLLVAVLAGCLLIGGVVLVYETQGLADNPNPNGSNPAVSSLTLAQIPFNGQQSYDFLKQICALGPRPSASPGMLAQQKLLTDHFEKLGAKVKLQQFRIRHPQDGSEVRMANLWVQWHPERKERILLAAHYDTRPFPDRDPTNPRGKFVGANDGASGVALLMQMGYLMPALAGKVGVDFVLFDGEEFVFNDNTDLYFLGSEYFAQQYAAGKLDVRYRSAIVLDMIADADLQIFEERYSLGWKDSSPLVKEIWKTAAKLKVKEFIPRPKYSVRDDHLPLHDTGKIPSIDVIDLDYPHWHTEADSADKCSALSLAKVGWVMHEWLKGAVVR